MSSRYAIRYESRSTVNGQPVGTVFAQRMCEDNPRAGWTYTKAATAATLFDSEDAARDEIGRHSWPFAEVVVV